MYNFLRIIGNKFLSLVITVLIATIPFWLFLICEISYGWSNGHSLSPLRVDECFLFFATVMGIATLLIEIGRLFPNRISGVFNFISLIPACGFAAANCFMDHTFNFFQCMCCFGIAFYPYVYVLTRKFINQSFWTILAPIAAFSASLLTGVFITLIGRASSMVLVYQVPFYVSISIFVIMIVIFAWKGLSWFSTSFSNFIYDHLPTIPGNSNKDRGDTGDDEDKKKESDQLSWDEVYSLVSNLDAFGAKVVQTSISPNVAKNDFIIILTIKYDSDLDQGQRSLSRSDIIEEGTRRLAAHGATANFYANR